MKQYKIANDEHMKTEYDKLRARAKEESESMWVEAKAVAEQKTIATRHAMDNVLATLYSYREQLQQTHTTLTAALEEAYNKNIIFPKYRGLVPVITIAEYIESGRCEALEGSGGAYNLYESELRANSIIAHLETIIKELEAIRENQYSLSQILSTVNANVRRVSDKIGNLSDALIESQERAMNDMHANQSEMLAAMDRSARATHSRLNTQNEMLAYNNRLLSDILYFNH